MILKFNSKTTMKKLFNHCIALIVVCILGFITPSTAQIIIGGPDTSLCQGAQLTLTVQPALNGMPLLQQGNWTNLQLNDDQWSASINLPFPFTFYGNVYNSCIIGSNNVLSLTLLLQAVIAHGL